jgi:hypothetical protein
LETAAISADTGAMAEVRLGQLCLSDGPCASP